jgi:hypothetical protein
MRAWPLHLVFAAILVGSLAAREWAADRLDADAGLEAAAVGLAQAYGLVLRTRTTVADTDVPALEFAAPGCSGPLLVSLPHVTLDQEPVLRAARAPGHVLRYIYIDRRWDEPDRSAMVVERMKHAALAAFGLTPYRPTWRLLATIAPADCRSADAVDWRKAWSRDQLRVASNAADTAAR